MPLPDNVEVFPGVTKNNFQPDIVLQNAIGAGLKQVVVIGEGPDGTEYFSSGVASGPEVLWMLERAKLNLLRTVDGDDE